MTRRTLGLLLALAAFAACGRAGGPVRSRPTPTPAPPPPVELENVEGEDVEVEKDDSEEKTP